jgi:hypothetical protein
MSNSATVAIQDAAEWPFAPRLADGIDGTVALIWYDMRARPRLCREQHYWKAR